MPESSYEFPPHGLGGRHLAAVQVAVFLAGENDQIAEGVRIAPILKRDPMMHLKAACLTR